MEKLIRDTVKDISHPDYPNMTIRYVSSVQEHIALLILKIQEESEEFKKAPEKEKIEEGIDIMEASDVLLDLYKKIGDQTAWEKVVHLQESFLEELLHIFHIEEDTVKKKQKEKREKRGSFQEGIVWIY